MVEIQYLKRSWLWSLRRTTTSRTFVFCSLKDYERRESFSEYVCRVTSTTKKVAHWDLVGRSAIGNFEQSSWKLKINHMHLQVLKISANQTSSESKSFIVLVLETIIILILSWWISAASISGNKPVLIQRSILHIHKTWQFKFIKFS